MSFVLLLVTSALAGGPIFGAEGTRIRQLRSASHDRVPNAGPRGGDLLLTFQPGDGVAVDSVGLALDTDGGLVRLTPGPFADAHGPRDAVARTFTIPDDAPLGQHTLVLTVGREVVAEVDVAQGSPTLAVLLPPGPAYAAAVEARTGRHYGAWQHAHAMAAGKTSSMFLPEVDDEVIVAFNSRYDRGVQAAADGRLTDDLARSTDVPTITRALSWRGNDEVLWGRWDGDARSTAPSNVWGDTYDDGKEPWVWTSGAAFVEDPGPVKYGQCWVFASLAAARLQGVGIPARVVTNFRSATERYDAGPSTDVQSGAPYAPTGDACLVTSRDGSGESVWNFHVWTEAWVEGRDGKEAGWHAIDSTSQERADGDVWAGPTFVDDILVSPPHGGEGGVLFSRDPAPPVQLPIGPASLATTGLSLRAAVVDGGGSTLKAETVAKRLTEASTTTDPRASWWDDATGHVDMSWWGKGDAASLVVDGGRATFGDEGIVLLLVPTKEGGDVALDPTVIDLLRVAGPKAIVPLFVAEDDLKDDAFLNAQLRTAELLRTTGGVVSAGILARLRKRPDLLTAEWDDLVDEAIEQLRENPLASEASAETVNPLFGEGVPDLDDLLQRAGPTTITLQLLHGALYEGDRIDLLDGRGGKFTSEMGQIHATRDAGFVTATIDDPPPIDADFVSYTTEGATQPTIRANVGPIRWMAPESLRRVQGQLGEVPEGDSFITGHGAKVKGIYSEKASYVTFDGPTDLAVGSLLLVIREGGRTIGAGQVTEILE